MKSSRLLSILKTYLVFILLLTLVISVVGFSASCSSGEAKSETAKKKKKKRKKKKRKKKKKKKKKDKADEEDSHDDKKPSKDEKHGKKTDNDHKTTESTISAEDIWSDLIKGNKNFVSGKHSNGHFVASRKKLIKGQHPDVIVIGCADSRVPPELVFNKNLGELFVIRTAGNIADPIALGSIEYAADHLHSKVLVVLGHEFCGAVGASLSKDKMPTANLRAIVKPIRRSFKSEKECKLGSENNIKCVKLNIAQSAMDIISRSPIIKKLVKNKKIKIIEAIYRMESGKVERLN